MLTKLPWLCRELQPRILYHVLRKNPTLLNSDNNVLAIITSKLEFIDANDDNHAILIETVKMLDISRKYLYDVVCSDKNIVEPDGVSNEDLLASFDTG